MSAVSLETGSGRAGLFIHRAGLGRARIFLQQNGPGRAELFSGRAGLNIFGRTGLQHSRQIVLIEAGSFYPGICGIDFN